MSVVVGVLTIDLKANTAAFSQSMDKMSSLSAKTSTDIKRTLERIALAGVAMAGAIITATTASIMGALNAADALGKFAASAGTTSETLSVLKYAASLSNLATEDLVKGLEKLSLTAFKAQNGNVGLERIFQKLGVSVTGSNGKLKDSGLLMEELAAKLGKMQDSGGKTALVMQLFGRGGAQLIPMLNQLATEQAKVTDEAQRFGLVMGTSTTELAAKAHDNLERLQLMLKGIGYSLLGAVLPALDGLLERLVQIAREADIPSLMQAFGARVSTVIRAVGDALEFVLTHITAVKYALAGLAAIGVARIAIPVIGDLAGGGISNLGGGIAKLMLGFAGLGKVVPQLTAFAGWLGYTTKFIALMAKEEGVAAAASYVLGGAFAAVTAPAVLITGAVLAAVAAIAGLAYAAYKFRDSTIMLGGEAYKLRDTWNAVWIGMGWAVTGATTFFKSQMEELKGIWLGLINYIAERPIVVKIMKALDLPGADARLEGYVSGAVNAFAKRWNEVEASLRPKVPGVVIGAMNQARDNRVLKGYLDASATDLIPGAKKNVIAKAAPDTSGLGKVTESPVNKVLANLQEKLDESKLTLASAGLDEEAQRKAGAANKASQEIMKLGQEIAKQTGAKTKDYASLVKEATQETIRNSYALTSNNEMMTERDRLLGAGSRSTATNIEQAALMSAAMDQGADAIMRQTAATAALLELQKFGADQKRDDLRASELYRQALAQEDLSTKSMGISLRLDTADRNLAKSATLGSIDAQRAASLQAKLFAFDQKVVTAATQATRQAIIDQAAAENKLADAQNALALLSPEVKTRMQLDALQHNVVALKEMQGGTLDYAETLQVAMKKQEFLNQQIDETVNLLLFQGDAGSGMKAFFLDMQKQAITSAQIIYEALHQTFEKLTDNLTELMTGGQTSFGKMFQDIGKQMMHSTIQSNLQQGMSALAKVLPASIGGPLGDALKGKPDGSRSNPLWVQMAGSSAGAGGYMNELGDMVGGKGGGYLNELGDLIGGRGKTGGSSSSGLLGSIGGFFSGLIPHAQGGQVAPGSAYLVGERGPEILTGASGYITSNSDSRRTSPTVGGDTYAVDARGSNDPAAVEAAVQRGIRLAAPRIAAGGVMAMQEQKRRSPLTAR